MPDLHIDSALAVNDILRSHPAMMPLLAAAGIDTCCGGAESLRDAARMAGTDISMLLGAMRIELARLSVGDVVAAGATASYGR